MTPKLGQDREGMVFFYIKKFLIFGISRQKWDFAFEKGIVAYTIRKSVKSCVFHTKIVLRSGKLLLNGASLFATLRGEIGMGGGGGG